MDQARKFEVRRASWFERAVGWVASRCRRRNIFDTQEGESVLYLTRFYLPIRWPVRVYLHRIWREDYARELHNHPWRWSFSLVIQGWYREENREGPVVHRSRWSWRLLRHSSYHRIQQVSPDCWTLFVAGPKTHSWGFLMRSGHVDHRDYESERKWDRDGRALNGGGS